MIKKIVLAGGCFWGLEELLRGEAGVVDTECGYCGGLVKNPTYRSHEGHAEAVEVTYDTDKTTLTAILDFFFRIHNPTTLDRQGNDIGSSYRSTIFYTDAEEEQIAREVIARVDNSKRWPKPVVTTLEALGAERGAQGVFWPAEDYHQDYLQKNPHGYTCHQIYCASYF